MTQTQAQKARTFAALHTPGDPVVIYNIWDAGGAAVLAEAGAKAVATGSWSVAAAHGYEDGEAIPLAFLLQIVDRIAASTDLPVSVDFEGAYATDPEGVASNTKGLIEAGAVGCNFEDRVVGGDGLHDIAAQTARIAAMREAAGALPFFINARTDLFLQADAADHSGLIDDALRRAEAYASAGASGFFIPGLTDPTLITRIVEATTLPVNAMMRGTLTSLADASAMNVARASFGPGPYLWASEDLKARFAGLG